MKTTRTVTTVSSQNGMIVELEFNDLVENRVEYLAVDTTNYNKIYEYSDQNGKTLAFAYGSDVVHWFVCDDQWMRISKTCTRIWSK